MVSGKESNSAGGSFTKLNPPEPKKRKLDKSKCIICLNNRGNEPLRKAKDSSVQKLVTSARQSVQELVTSARQGQDEGFERLIDILDGEIY